MKQNYITLKVYQESHRKLKTLAALRGKTMLQALEEMLIRELARETSTREERADSSMTMRF